MEKTIERITPRREKAQAIYEWTEGAVKVVLAASIKMGICGAIGMLGASLLLNLHPTPYFWACSCAGILAYRWLSRLISIKPKKKKRR